MITIIFGGGGCQAKLTNYISEGTEIGDPRSSNVLFLENCRLRNSARAGSPASKFLISEKENLIGPAQVRGGAYCIHRTAGEGPHLASEEMGSLELCWHLQGGPRHLLVSDSQMGSGHRRINLNFFLKIMLSFLSFNKLHHMNVLSAT